MVKESTLRNKLYNKGYKLITVKSVMQYGVRCKEYAIADKNNIIVTGENMDLEDVQRWIEGE